MCAALKEFSFCAPLLAESNESTLLTFMTGIFNDSITGWYLPVLSALCELHVLFSTVHVSIISIVILEKSRGDYLQIINDVIWLFLVIIVFQIFLPHLIDTLLYTSLLYVLFFSLIHNLPLLLNTSLTLLISLYWSTSWAISSLK